MVVEERLSKVNPPFISFVHLPNNVARIMVRSVNTLYTTMIIAVLSYLSSDEL